MIPLLVDNLRARRTAAIAMALGLAAIAVGYLALFPQLEDQLQAFAGDLPEFYGAIIGDANFATPEGYVRTQVFALVAPLLASGIAISVAAGFAKAERSVTLTDAYLAPITRRVLGWSHLAAAWSIGLFASLAVFVGVLLGAPLAGAEVGVTGVAAASLAFLGLTWAAATTAWTVGVATGSPGAASGAGWAFLGISFLANSIGEVVESASLLSDISPWGWYGAGAPVTDGFDPAALLLFVFALVFAPVGAALLDRRDLQL